MLHDVLANALSVISNAENASKSIVLVKPASKLARDVFELLKKEGYIVGYEYVDDRKGGLFKVELKGNINKIGVIKPRFPVKLEDYEKFEKRYLPAKDFGRIIVSTNQKLMTHIEAKEKKLGGVLIAYVY